MKIAKIIILSQLVVLMGSAVAGQTKKMPEKDVASKLGALLESMDIIYTVETLKSELERLVKETGWKLRDLLNFDMMRWDGIDGSIVFRTALMDSSISTKALGYFVKNGGDLNMTDSAARTSLVRIMRGSNDSTRGTDIYHIERLINLGAKLNSPKPDDVPSPLFEVLAIDWHGSHDAQDRCKLINLMVDKGANINEVSRDQTILIHVISLFKQFDRSVELGCLLKQKGINLDWQDRGGKTALHHAIESGNRYIVEQLLSKNADPDKVDKLGKTADSYTNEKKTKEIFKEARDRKKKRA